MKKYCILLLVVLSLNTFAQENERQLRSYRDYRERNENRFDWSKSKVYFYLKEYCTHDFRVSHPDVVEFINTCGLEAGQVAGRGMDGIYLDDRFQKLPDLPNNEPNPSNEIEGPDKYQVLKKFNIIHLGLKNILQKEVQLDEDTEETAFETISIKELYKIILEEINYWPDMNDVSKDYIMFRYRQILAEKRLEQYEKDKEEAQVKELENLFSKWQEITSTQLWEKQLLCENNEVLQSVEELKEALRYKEINPLSPGVLVKNGNRIPYKVIDGKLVVDGLCTLVYKDEQATNATGEWFKKYTTNLKLIVKVENGRAISQTISGTQKWWDENKTVFKNTKGSPLTKAAAMAKAKPVVIRSHNVTKIEDLGFGAELGIMHRDLSYVLGNASVEANSLTDLYKEYLLNPSPEGLNRIKKPFMPVDISALPTR